MTRDEAKKLLPVIQAFAEGKDVQFYGRVDGQTALGPIWHDTDDPSFDECTQWRIKPEPLECWVMKNSDGLLIDVYDKEDDAKRDLDSTRHICSFDRHTIHHMREVIE